MDEKTVARFFPNVDKRGADECWPWRGCRDAAGYGRFSVKREHGWRAECAHRVSFEIANGKRGVVVRHSCDNPPCCNPAHLLDGSHADNMRDMAERNRRKGKPGAHGEQSSSRFTLEDIVRIRSEVANGPRGTSIALARRYGVARCVICDIVARRRWAYDA